jgi:hypothetical protein
MKEALNQLIAILLMFEKEVWRLDGIEPFYVLFGFLFSRTSITFTPEFHEGIKSLPITHQKRKKEIKQTKEYYN